MRLLGAGADVNRVCVCVCPPAAGGAVCILRPRHPHLQRARVSGAYFSCPHTSLTANSPACPTGTARPLSSESHFQSAILTSTASPAASLSPPSTSTTTTSRRPSSPRPPPETLRRHRAPGGDSRHS